MSEGELFVITGLISRGGLSNWVFFFLPDELLMIDLGIKPTLTAGVRAGIGGGQGVYGPTADATQGLHAWSEELRAKAKQVVSMKDAELRVIRWRLNMMAHELFVVGADGTSNKFGLMNRNEAAKTLEPLKQRFGSRAEVVKTRAYRFLERYAPALL